MNGMLTIEFAVLALFDAVGSVALFFHRRVVATLALSALQSNLFACHIVAQLC